MENPKSETLGSRKPSTLNSHPPIDLRSWEWRYLWQQTRSDGLFTLWVHSNRVWGTAWAPDGKRIATAGADSSSEDSSMIEIWSVSERRVLRTFKQPGRVREIRFVNGDELLTVGEQDLTIKVSNSSTGRTLEFPTGEKSLFAVCLSADRRVLAAAGQTWVRLWNVVTQREIARPDPGEDMGASDRAIAISADGKRFAYYKSDGPTDESSMAIVLWDVEKAAVIDELKGHTDRVYKLASLTPKVRMTSRRPRSR